jgi:hypothetical protein
VDTVGLADHQALSCNLTHCFIVGSLKLLSSVLELISIVGKLTQHLLNIVTIVKVLGELAMQHLYLLSHFVYLLPIKELLTFDVLHHRNLSRQAIREFLSVVNKYRTLVL